MLVFDLEANGLLDNATVIHCLCILDTETNTLYKYPPEDVPKGIKYLQDYLNDGGKLCGHNIINYDLPLLTKLHNFALTYPQEKQIVDTIVLARLIYSNLDTIDLGKMKAGTLPNNLYKSHTLKAWGYRLGILKGTYGEQQDAWTTYNEEMLEYNAQDVIVTNKLYEKCMNVKGIDRAIELEHQVAFLMARQERNGYPFNIEKAEELECQLRSRTANLKLNLMETIPPIKDKVFIPKADNKTKGYKKGVPIQRYKTFNPTSRQQIEYVLREMYHYSPLDMSLYDGEEIDLDHLENYRLKIDETTFNFIKEDERANQKVKDFISKIDELLLLSKRLGQLADGQHGWLKLYNKETKAIHGRVITNGAVTGRATHSSPNIAQVPSITAPYGKECRELFHSKDWIQVGADVSGLELRCLAHYMTPYDAGEYAKEILEGDIHTKNQINAGLPSRNAAKTFIYALLYGAGDEKIGQVIGGGTAEGKAIKRKFLANTPALKRLREDIQNTLANIKRGRVDNWKRQYLKGLDGRLLYVRSLHSALNLLLQSAGAIICKKWIVTIEELLEAKGLQQGWDKDYVYMAWIHDEVQLACKDKETALIVAETTKEAIDKTKEYFNIRIDLDVDYKLGKNWAECH